MSGKRIGEQNSMTVRNDEGEERGFCIYHRSDFNAAVVEFGNALHQRQPYAVAFDIGGIVAAKKRLKNIRNIFGCNDDTGVGKPNFDIIFHRKNIDHYL